MNQCIIIRRDFLSELILVQGNIYGAPSLCYQSVNHCCKMSVWEAGKEIYEEKKTKENDTGRIKKTNIPEECATIVT